MSGLDITQIDHVSVIITDVERSRRFYAGLLGLREIAKPRTFAFVVLWFDLGDMHLHLLLKDHPDTISPRHFALRVNDAQLARQLSGISRGADSGDHTHSRSRSLLCRRSGWQ